ncbi:MAG: hypothetical protein WCL32_03440 [Planctomycetota bacterium]
MVTIFCLRLALGMVAPMMILPAQVVPPRFFRVQFLTALALLVIGVVLSGSTGALVLALFAASIVVCLVGSIVWHTDEAPFGRLLFFAGTGLIAGTLGMLRLGQDDSPTWLFVDDLASALMLGSAISAMLMGHSYLIAPAMSLSPLNRMLGLLAAALGVRAGLACLGLSWWTRLSPSATLDRETVLWLAARWVLGLLFPLGLAWMAWESARIRSTQSATGILYVVTVLVFLGELLSMLLAEKFGFPM